MTRKRSRVERSEDWEQLELLCAWDEQREYERIRPLVLFGESVPERAAETGTSERTLYRRIAGFEENGMGSLFGSVPAKRRVLPASLRRLIVDLKAEHPPSTSTKSPTPATPSPAGSRTILLRGARGRCHGRGTRTRKDREGIHPRPARRGP